MTIQELADRAEVTTRTIRYYVDQGVLPPPGRGRPAEYTEEHVALLALIKRLKEQYLPLEEIRDATQRLSKAELEQLVELHSIPQEQAQQQKLDSAADYISGVLRRGPEREELKRKASAPSDAADHAAGGLPKFSTAQRAEQDEIVITPEQTPPPFPITPAAMPAPQDAPATFARPGSGSGGSVTAASRSAYIPPPAPTQAPEPQASRAAETPPTPSPVVPNSTTWERVDLGEGTELHYLAGGSAHTKGKVAKLIEAARHILGLDPENGE